MRDGAFYAPSRRGGASGGVHRQRVHWCTEELYIRVPARPAGTMHTALSCNASMIAAPHHAHHLPPGQADKRADRGAEAPVLNSPVYTHGAFLPAVFGRCRFDSLIPFAEGPAMIPSHMHPGLWSVERWGVLAEVVGEEGPAHVHTGARALKRMCTGGASSPQGGAHGRRRPQHSPVFQQAPTYRMPTESLGQPPSLSFEYPRRQSPGHPPLRLQPLM
jgi:hypothetical protein